MEKEKGWERRKTRKRKRKGTKITIFNNY